MIELRDGWNRTLAELRSVGWKAEITCAAAPVQLEGVAPNGEPFAFRARHDIVELQVDAKGPDDRASWSAAVQQEGASYLTGEQGIQILLELWQRYLEHVDSR